MRPIDADALIEFMDPGHLRHPGELALDKAIEIVKRGGLDES